MTNTTFAYRVSADVRYLDGSLDGITIKGGWTVTYPTLEYAQKAAEWATRCYLAEVEVAAAGTRNSYLLVSAPVLEVA